MADHAQDLYAILGVSPEATAADIKAAYRVAARRFHPDANSHMGAQIQFRDIAAAHEVLADDKQRRNYDNLRKRLEPDPDFLSVKVTPSKRILPILNEHQVVYVLVEITAPEEFTSPKKKLAPLNLVLVLDRSTSMRGARLDRVKVAAHQIIDQLDENDYLSIITFSDRADRLIPSTPVRDRSELKSTVNIMSASGGTEIYQGLKQGLEEAKRHVLPNCVSHIILLTDGQTYDAEFLSLELADEAVKDGIGISAMGIGDEWNDIFLDELASRTGGSSAYINSPGAVVRFLNERVRSLGASYAERLHISVAPDADVKLESVFKLVPSPQPISLDNHPLQLGTLEKKRPIKLLLQLQMSENLKVGFRTLMRLDIAGDILHSQRNNYKVLSDISIEVAKDPATSVPPRPILDALGKLTLYRMQQKAEESIKSGNIEEATRRLENLSTRLLAAGHEELAQTAITEARRIQATRKFSEAGRKTIKFGTRMLLLESGEST